MMLPGDLVVQRWAGPLKSGPGIDAGDLPGWPHGCPAVVVSRVHFRGRPVALLLGPGGCPAWDARGLHEEPFARWRPA